MPSLDDIKAQIKNFDEFSKFIGKREISELPNILWDDEKIEHIASGRYNKGFGILVATNKRLIFIDKGWVYGLKVEDFPYDKISSIQYKTGLVFGEITIFTSGNKAEIDRVDKKRSRNFAEFVRTKISNIHSQGNIGDASNNKNDVLEQLERLAKLKEKGILSDEEFNTQKQKLLNL